MQQYDIAAKVLIESCKDDIIRAFLNMPVCESALIEALPQETPIVKRSDYPVMITDAQGVQTLVIIEIQTRWHRKLPLNLLDYRTRHILVHDVKAVSCVILLRPSGAAVDCYRDDEVNYAFRLVKIFEMDGRDIIDNGPLCLLPFVPLMKNGPELIKEADEMIYQSPMSTGEKADVLTTMAIFSGLVSKDMPMELIARRKDIMIESAAYEIFKKEWMQHGIQEGISYSLQTILELKFGLDGIKLYEKLRHIKNADRLISILEAVKIAKTPEEILNVAFSE